MYMLVQGGPGARGRGERCARGARGQRAKGPKGARRAVAPGVPDCTVLANPILLNVLIKQTALLCTVQSAM